MSTGYLYAADDGSSSAAAAAAHSSSSSISPTDFAQRSPNLTAHQRWPPPRAMPHQKSHSRTRSLSEVIRDGRRRAASVSAGEVVETLKAPVSWKLVCLCLVWYFASGASNTSAKTILNSFPKPVTVSLLQFWFVSTWCLVLSLLARFIPFLGRAVPGLQGGLLYPNKYVVYTTAPLAIFQVGGHIASSVATGKIAVSLVHTIKGLSPLFTVFAYRALFSTHYSTATYLSLIPLTLGVMMACSAEFRGHFIGVLMAFISTIIFVSQNIFAKKIFNESSMASDPSIPTHRRKLDKLNLLFYSAGQAFLLTTPLWLYSEGGALIQEYLSTGSIQLAHQIEGKKEAPLTGWGLTCEFFFNGTVHFGQNIIAFVLLSLVSPVTYSVASLIKRIFVIIMAMIRFRDPITNVQGAGVLLTFLGLYLYDRAGDASRAEKRARFEQSKPEPLLPLNTSDIPRDSADIHNRSAFSASSHLDPVEEKAEGYLVNGSSQSGGPSWLLPGAQKN